MKVGLFINTQFPEGDAVAARIPELVEQVRVARDFGFASVLFPHHYLTAPLRRLQITPLLAYLLPERCRAVVLTVYSSAVSCAPLGK